MTQSKWFFHPIFIFILSIIALGLSLFLYIYWYVEASAGFNAVVERFGLKSSRVLESQTWMVIVVLSILVGFILMGLLVIFVYFQKTYQLYRLQNNFINSFTHELKTPVTSLKLYLETFLKHELTRDDQSKYINYMLTDINRLAENISSILNLAKIESKSLDGEFVEMDIASEIERFYNKNKHLFSNCRIAINRSPDYSYIYAIDQTLFEMLLMNLLTNAAKYNNSEYPSINITFEEHEGKLHICFSDNGIGLEKTEIKKIFKKFYQVGLADNMSAKGSGIGLYLAQSIARMHKGKIIAESEGRGRGSVFTLVLPYAKRRQ